MDITVLKNGSKAEIAITGNLSVMSANRFKKYLAGILEDNKINQVVFDLSKVSFLGSTGVREIAQFHRDFTNNRGKRITFTNINIKIKEIFEFFKLDDMLHSQED